MYRRPRHNKVAVALAAMDAAFLRESKCYFGGGTAIALQLDEYRHSDDVDFLCSDPAGYRRLRESVFERGLQDLFPAGIETVRDLRADRDGVRTFLRIDGEPLKFEIVLEGRIALDGESVVGLPVHCVARPDLYAEKLLANADRYLDRSVLSRDVIDLLVMAARWGEIPDVAWKKARDAYGKSVDEAFEGAKELLRGDPAYLESCLQKMAVDETAASQVRGRLARKPGARKPNAKP